MKRFSNTKSVEASDFVISEMYFSQHMNSGKRFALYEFNLRCIVQNIYLENEWFIKDIQ
jgi:hypothetical protein